MLLYTYRENTYNITCNNDLNVITYDFCCVFLKMTIIVYNISIKYYCYRKGNKIIKVIFRKINVFNLQHYYNIKIND